MIRRVSIYFTALAVVFFVTYFFHSYYHEDTGQSLSYSLLDMYFFHAISSLFVYIAVEIINLKFSHQTGYAYLVLVFLKIGFFAIIFSSSLLSEISLNMLDRISIIIPMFLFLTLEAIFCSRLLNDN
ncbi:MAG: DUF6168 family protein [Cyclobacteriaceae bacterium]|nr:DUF6168 family protein [Cyclobacteriaceae bacterium]